MRQFVAKSFFLYLFLGLIAAGVFSLWFKPHYTPIIPVLFLYFFVVTILVFGIHIRIQKQPNIRFSQYFTLLTIIKFFLSIVVFGLSVAFNRDKVISLVSVFMVLYIASLAIEVRGVKSYMSKITKK